MKKLLNDIREAFDRAILRSLEAVHARALGYDYNEVWAMGIACAQVGLREDEIRGVLIRGLRVDSPERKDLL